MRVLVACEYSGTVRDAFIEMGHEAISCDLLPTDKPGPHYQGDVFDLLNWNPLKRFDFNDGFGRTKSWFPNHTHKNLLGFDLLIAHPPCTFLCNSGVRWLAGNEERHRNMVEGANFFKKLLEANVQHIAVENPIMHKYAKEIIGSSQTQIIQPWQFGHGETKATCLWLKNLPLLKPTKIVEGREQRIHLLPPSKDRWKLRSTTYLGIAKAMAEQWSNLC
jgi:hypothetical protein